MTPVTPSTAEQCGALSQLSLSGEELGALERQGFVSREFRGDRGPFFKLRFRLNGKQRVRYLGLDQSFAAKIAEDLTRLQRGRQMQLKLDQLAGEFRQLMRQTKRDLQEGLREYGLAFHGLQVRDRSKS